VGKNTSWGLLLEEIQWVRVRIRTAQPAGQMSSPDSSMCCVAVSKVFNVHLITIFLSSCVYSRNAMAEWGCLISSVSAVLGAWLGAFPIPLDWDRPWQVVLCRVVSK